MRLQFYRDRASQCRWRLRAANGQIIAGPQEGYADRDYTQDIAATVLGGSFITAGGEILLLRADGELIKVEYLW